MPKTYAYIRVSTNKQDLENQKFAILQYANNKKLGNVEFIEEAVSGRISWKNRKLKDLIDNLQSGDNLIVAELSRLGRSMLEIMELLSILLRKGVNVYVVKGNYELKDNIQSKVLTFAFSLASEIERELISQRTKEALAKRKAEGKKLGRPKGSYSSKLDDKKEYIKELLDKGVSIASIAKILGVHYHTVRNYVKRRNLK
ncbi:recombinase family protein [Hydrogenivirga sp. 128-5-R1-1]|uniref:recombinase family protein n=1 Tax=Hydrogenivirga sp. 128-5-R1-1 TaxID=392423 RepID=UPI00015F082F|nr:recombinase family protein [Hydrogenivirga sp. 128-5-R1-1]EDP73153.1 site-specific recombinase, resolvase family protein [Hydrogenivirga sp. 128-5-R1-1]